MLDTHMPDAATKVGSQVPAGCWIDQSDWSDWPQGEHACSPNEWPYNLEAPKGTREFCRIIDWFLRNHPQLYGPDLGQCLALIEECAPGKTVTARVSYDPEMASYTLWFTMYECQMDDDLDSQELTLYCNREREFESLSDLNELVAVWHHARPFPGHKNGT